MAWLIIFAISVFCACIAFSMGAGLIAMALAAVAVVALVAFSNSVDLKKQMGTGTHWKRRKSKAGA
jgi:hypothetical protein